MVLGLVNDQYLILTMNVLLGLHTLRKKMFAKPIQKTAPKLASIEVVALKKFQTRLPKGRERKKLLREGRIIKIKLSRDMTAEQVKQRITENFEDLPGFSYQLKLILIWISMVRRPSIEGGPCISVKLTRYAHLYIQCELYTCTQLTMYV